MTSNRMFSTDSSYPYSSFEESKPEYIIHPYDKLSIKVYTNKGDRLIDVKGELKNMQDPIIYSVEHDGQVKVPTIGRINLAGLTLRQAETLLEESYKAYYNDPFVFIQVTNKRVIVFNSGSSGGHVVNFDNENYTLIEALAEAGGISDVGKAYKIKLLRGDLNNPEVYTFNVRKLKDIKSVNFQLQANDIIYVEDRPRYGSKVLQEVMPYLTLFTSVFTVYLLVSK
ncbi:MAG: polysaccharide biosynthesis/export family protein [Bacteroidales bacterium]|nr:polysaccharide biosynthesis/export family protein [Bacteroidales bacterium]